MSLLSPDQLGIALFPERLVLARTSGGFRRRLAHKEIVACAPAEPGEPLWLPAVNALAAKVAAGALAKADVTLVLSNRFVHYTVVPWSDTLGGKEEELAFARHCFARVHGSDADEWEIKLSGAKPRKPRLACAVEQSLIEDLNARMSPLASRYRSLQPHLMASFNRTRARLGERAAWLVVAEPGLLCLALLQDGCWQSVRTINVGADWMSELPGVLAREECMVDSETECGRVLVFAPDSPQIAIPHTGKWRFEHLAPGLLPGMIAGTDAPYSIALGD
ncbi:MAG: hypothetical protein HY661_19850 [Betaproteobacteria bacterium]|nr:hypothetical protein [Betaproteobacteria bacterium]